MLDFLDVAKDYPVWDHQGVYQSYQTFKDAFWFLSKGFLIMLAISILITAPLAKVINDIWFREFAVKIEFGFEILTTGILIMLVLGLFTIFSQTFKSARSNPVETLRYE